MPSASAMQQPSLSEVMNFRKSWRTYQSRLLDRLDRYLANKRLHLVAAPGSGKTVLGLEVIRRINQPTLVLAPTITIRDQWVDRLIELFLAPGSGRPDWVSTNLRIPKFVTVATYQALHAVCSGQTEEPTPVTVEENGASKNHFEAQTNGDEENHVSHARVEIPEFLTQVGFKTLVLDEAHHLRAEWWRVLTSFSERLRQPTIVALTATPPYDVSPFEWQRYEELCGPVDAEVAVPELVQEKDLCPHQDYVYFNTPNEQELKVLTDFRAAVDLFTAKLRANPDFGNAVARHPWLASAEQHT